MLNKKLLGSVSSLPQDDNFENVTLLLNGDGTNGGQNNTFVDSSTNNFTITRNGNTTQGSFSPYGNLWSVSNTTGDYFTLPSAIIPTSGSATWTIEGFVFPTSTTGNIMFVTQAIDQSASRFTIYILENGTIGINRASTNIVTTTGAVTLNSWNHIAITRNGSAFTVWINGTSAGTGTNANAIDNTATKLLGVFSGNGQEFKGYVSNLRITNTVVYSSTFTPATQNLTAISGTQLLTFQSNRFVDNSSNAHAITVTGTPSVQRFSPFEPSAPYSTSVIGGSGYFDNIGDNLTLPSDSAFAFGTGDFTVEFWIYTLDTDGYNTVLGTRPNSSNHTDAWTVGVGSDYTIYMYSNGFIVGPAGSAAKSTWNHVAVTRSGTSVKLFINGTQVGSTGTNSQNFTQQVLRIGANNDGSEPFNGYLSNLRIVKGTAVYTTNFTPPTAPVTAITNTSLLCNMTNASIADLAMQNNLETVGNAQVSTSVKKFGTGSLAFDGTGDRLKFKTPQPFIFGTGNFTVEGWVYFNSVATAVLIGDVNNNTGASVWSVLFNSASNVLRLTCNVSTTYSFSWTPVATTWYHFAVCRSGTSLRAFINGTQIGTTQTSSDNIASTNGSGDFYLGSTNDGALQLNGNLDDIRVSNVARYTANFTPPASALPTF